MGPKRALRCATDFSTRWRSVEMTSEIPGQARDEERRARNDEGKARCFDKLSNRAAVGPSTGSGTDPFGRPFDKLRDRLSTGSGTGPSIISN